MREWPSSVLFEEASGDPGDKGGTGDKDPKETKIKVGSREYDNKSLEAATTLYDALQDESTGREIIETLARRAGLLDKKEVKEDKPKDKVESRSAKKLREKFGKDYEKFADTLGPALDELLEERLEELRGGMEAEGSQAKWESSVDKFINKYQVTPELEEAMQELIEESPPNTRGARFNADRYLTRIYKNACEQLEVEPIEVPVKSSSRSKDEGFPDIKEIPAPKGMTLDDAVELAMKGIRVRRRS